MVCSQIPPPAVIDLCSGMGGLSCAARSLGMEIILGVDSNVDALKTYAKNFPEASAALCKVGHKKTTLECQKAVVEFTSANQPLIIVSGPPCQGFSIAGSRDPKDKRNKVLLSVADEITNLRPECALIENVGAMLGNRYSSTISAFRKRLMSASYHCEPIVLNAQEYGVPQNRKRAFFLVTKASIDMQAFTESLELYKQDHISVEEALHGLPHAPERALKYHDESDIGPISNHFAMRHSQKVKNKIKAIPAGTGPMSYRKLNPNKPANTLFSGHRAPPAHYAYPRSITVREAARLQGFPDSFRIYGSFGNQMLQVTNAVPPPLAKSVLAELTKFCGLHTDESYD